MCRIIITDDHAILREGLIKIINSDKNFQVCADAKNGEELLDVLEKIECDLLLCDIEMPGISGLEVAKIVKEKYPHIKIVMLTMHADRVYYETSQRK